MGLGVAHGGVASDTTGPRNHLTQRHRNHNDTSTFSAVDRGSGVEARHGQCLASLSLPVVELRSTTGLMKCDPSRAENRLMLVGDVVAGPCHVATLNDR